MIDVDIGMMSPPKMSKQANKIVISCVLISVENTEMQTLFRSLGGLKSNPKDKIKM